VDPAVKKQLPLLLGFLIGTFAIAEFYVPARGVRAWQSFFLEVGQVLAAAAYVLGGLNVIQVNVPIISRRREDWQFKVVLIVAAVGMGFAGIRWHELGGAPTESTVTLTATPAAAAPAHAGKVVVLVRANQDRFLVSIDGGEAQPGTGGSVGAVVEPGEHTVVVRSPETGYTESTSRFTAEAGTSATVNARLTMKWGPDGRVFVWIYDHLFAPCNATMFALLAFFIASAAFRAFRARNVEAGLLLGAAILVMLGLVPIGRAISSWFPSITEWIMEVPNNAGRRAIIMGAALGAIATSLRVILGLERSHLGKD
jgi:hypothetical protein